jgi:transcription elongation factor Elf1
MAERSCAQCGSKLQRFAPRRRRNNRGDLICERCYSGSRTHVESGLKLVCAACGAPPDVSGGLTASQGLLVCADGCNLRTVAHDSGDGVRVFHCPFCGGGMVTGRSDGSIECGYCKVTFTVQVQPAYPGLPQTINGEPTPWPGSLDGGPTPAMEQMGTELQPADSGQPDDDEEVEEVEDPPPFPVQSMYFRTADGGVLDYHSMVQHMAIRHSHPETRRQVIAMVRDDNQRAHRER